MQDINGNVNGVLATTAFVACYFRCNDCGSNKDHLSFSRMLRHRMKMRSPACHGLLFGTSGVPIYKIIT